MILSDNLLFNRLIKMWLARSILAIYALFPLSGLAVTNIQIVSEQFPPLQYMNGKENSGYVHQYIQETIRRVNLKLNIKVSSYEFLPWKRALLKAQSAPNVLLFSLSRTVKRENKYQWLGEVSVYQQSFHRLKNNPIKATNLTQVKALGYLLSVQNGGAVFDHLESLGFKYDTDFYYYFNYKQGLKQLFNKRVDLIALNNATARHATCMEGFDGDQLIRQIPIKALAKPL
ncbi:MAG: transporter substrate-binding domain-containing protein, partial [Oceanospirillaceae bacterium]